MRSRNNKGKLLQVSLANSRCEAMDESMNKMEGAQKKWMRDRLSEGETTDDTTKNEVTAYPYCSLPNGQVCNSLESVMPTQTNRILVG
jgi:hypothetical protein